MEYIVIFIGSLFITAVVGSQAIKYGGNKYFGLDSSKVFHCLCVGFKIMIEVFILMSFFILFAWAVMEARK